MINTPRILAVDDSPTNLRLLTEVIRAGGYEPLSASDGMTALQKVQAEMPDLVILDVTMPGMSGYEVCALMKADPNLKDIPVIMLTAKDSVANRVQGLNAGADDYLIKPASPRELLARIETRLRAKTQTEELRQAQQMIRKTFERFVPASVVEQLLQDPAKVNLGGTLQTITVMFADLGGFTAFSEATAPDRLLHILNSYHELIVHLIQEHGGTIDKFIGDAVMALYNTPLEQPDHQERAVRTALAVQAALPDFHHRMELNERLKINIGIHTGVAVVGNVGAPQIMNYTAVGDTVNVAARLQDRTKAGQILVSETVYQAVSHIATAENIGPQALKGRSEPVVAYQITGLR